MVWANQLPATSQGLNGLLLTTKCSLTTAAGAGNITG